MRASVLSLLLLLCLLLSSSSVTAVRLRGARLHGRRHLLPDDLNQHQKEVLSQLGGLFVPIGQPQRQPAPPPPPPPPILTQDRTTGNSTTPVISAALAPPAPPANTQQQQNNNGIGFDDNEDDPTPGYIGDFPENLAGLFKPINP